MKEAPRPTMAELWKKFDLDADSEAPKTPAVAINTVHGSVLTVITNQPVQLAELWEKTCAKNERPRP